LGFWSRLMGSERRDGLPPVSVSTRDPFLSEFLGLRGRSVMAGFGGPEEAVSTLAVAARCVSLISDGLAAMPLPVQEKQADGGRIPADGHPLNRILNDEANPRMSGFEFRELLVRDVGTYGNGYARIVCDGRGSVAELHWMPARLTFVERLRTGRLRYRFTDPMIGETLVLLAEEVIHIRFASRDGILGIAPMQWAAGAVGLAMSQSELAEDQVRRGFVPDLSFEQDPRSEGFSGSDKADAAFKRLKDQLTARVRNMRHDPSPLLLEGGITAKSLGSSGREAQFQEARVLGLEDVARVYGVPLSVVGLGKSGSYGSLTEESRSLVAYCLAPWAKRIETQLALALLSADGRKRYVVEHDLSGLLRGDMAARLQAYAVGITNGVFSPNECRRWEGLNSRPGGDAFLTPMNMQPNTSAAQL